MSLGCAGAAVAAPFLTPYLTILALPFLGTMLADIFEHEEFQKSVAATVTGLFTNLGSSAIEQLPGALAPGHNFHLERMLATAYLDSLAAIEEEMKTGGDKDLKTQGAKNIPLLKARIERGLRAEQPSTLFPLETKQQGAGTALVKRLSAEELSLLVADEERWRDQLGDEAEITLRRWLNEERAAEERATRQAPLGLTTIDDPLPDPLGSHLRAELPHKIAHRISELITRADFNASWVAFQRAHMQGMLRVIENIKTSQADIKQSVEALAKRIEGFAKQDEFVNAIAGKLEEFLRNFSLPNAELTRLLERQSQELLSLSAKIDQSTERLSIEGKQHAAHFIEEIRSVDKTIKKYGEALLQATSNRPALPPDVTDTGPTPFDDHDKERDPNWTSLDELVPDNTGSKEIGLALIEACNREAKSLYQKKVLGIKLSPVSQLWDGIWNEEDFEAQKNYVRLTDRENGQNVDYAVQRQLADGIEKDKPCKLWIVGAAGVGKTTVLYRSYFQLIGAVTVKEARSKMRPVPVPMLLQPRNLNAEQVYLLDQEKRTDAFIRLILRIWLYNRHIYIPPERKKELLPSLEYHLREGNIAILIDGFDELNRMDFQTSIFRNFFETVRHFVCASRPETDIHESQHKVIKLDSVWEFKTIESYLNDRLPKERKRAVKPFLSYLSRNDQVEWLRNPRNLNIILRLVESAEKSPDSEMTLIRVLETGEYKLHEELYKNSLSRLRRLAERTKSRHAHDPTLDQEIWKCFERIAEQQLKGGSFVLTKEEREKNEFWEIVKESKTLLNTIVADDHLVLRLHNFNLIDFFLTKKIANQIRSHNQLTFNHLWSTSQLAYLSEELRRSSAQPRSAIPEVWSMLNNFRLPRLDQTQGHRVLSPSDPRGFSAVNLLHLAIRLEEGPHSTQPYHNKMALRQGIEFLDKHLDNLYLDGVDLSHLTFDNCQFNGSILASGCLEKTVFRGCKFQQVDFQNVSASFAEFNNCEFDFHEEKYKEWYRDKPSAVHNMVIQDVKFRHCDGYDLETFKDSGARKEKTRYRGLFGDVFKGNQELLLGDGLQNAENYYVSAIKDYLIRLPSDRPVYLIDLMAGGSNARLRRLITGINTKRDKPVERHFENLHVLAIDRETSHLVEVSKEIGKRFAVVPKEIESRANLEEDLMGNFDGQPRQADLIIGKKALHELCKPMQRELMSECSETLKPEGRLILFTDSPESMSPDGYDRLQRYLEPLRVDDPKIAGLRRSLTENLRFTDSLDDCAIFSNLWVLIKDWANDNSHELKNRYFSSVEEIKQWGEEAGLRIINDPQQERDSYTLEAWLFNELGINEVGHYLEKHNNKIYDEDKDGVVKYLEGGEKYQLFREFAETHLWNHKLDQPSGLGKRLKASRKPIRLGKIHDALSDLCLPYAKGVAFEFSVHIIVFEKPR